MKTAYQRSFRFALMMLLLGLLPGIAAAKDGVKTVPIKGHFTGTVGITTLSISNATFQLDNVGHGNVSHLGRSKADWRVPEVQLDLTNQVLIVSNTTWTGTITAANGDQIIGVYTFRNQAIPFSISGDVSFDLDMEITGGTGRFQHATGSAVATGTANVISGKFNIRLNGRISSVGSSKHQP
jgi:hypothetical protein